MKGLLFLVKVKVKIKVKVKVKVRERKSLKVPEWKLDEVVRRLIIVSKSFVQVKELPKQVVAISWSSNTVK